MTLVPTLILLVDLRLLLCSCWVRDVRGEQLKGWQVDLFAGLMQDEGRMKKPVCIVAQMPKVEGHRYVRVV